ncbi:MAG: ribosome maturation factor RimM [Oscillospiraceae bacterium]|nr:ribosome maturation factor RimM [Oscillospiraceae bacterium]
MDRQFLEAGEITGTHGLHGDVKITPWHEAKDYLYQLDTLYVDGAPYAIEKLRPYKHRMLAKLKGVDDVETAAALKGKAICADRSQVQMPDGYCFQADLIGLEVRDADSGKVLGELAEVLTLPASDVYVIAAGKKELMVPAVDEFVAETNVEEGYIRLRVPNGMEDL